MTRDLRRPLCEAWIVAAVRTPIGRYGGALSSVRADDLAAIPIAALLERNENLEHDAVDARRGSAVGRFEALELHLSRHPVGACAA